MREIKFRAWSDNYKKFYYFDKGRYYRDSNTTSCVSERIFSGFLWSNAEQYTGLKDKNGKEIYENDILKGLNGKIREVGFNERRSQFGLYSRQLECWITNELLSVNEWEIIGNMHENSNIIDNIQ